MKKILIAMSIIAVTVLSFAFVNPFGEKSESNKQDNVYYRFDGSVSQQDYEDETKWVEVDDYTEIGCTGDGKVCWILYLDQANSLNPPTLPNGFDPFSITHGEKN